MQQTKLLTPSDIALDAISKLTKSINEEGDYFHVQVSFSHDDRAYICACPMLMNHLVIHEEYDNAIRSNNTRVINRKDIKSYLTSFNKIIFVGLETPGSCELSVLYNK